MIRNNQQPARLDRRSNIVERAKRILEMVEDTEEEADVAPAIGLTGDSRNLDWEFFDVCIFAPH